MPTACAPFAQALGARINVYRLFDYTAWLQVLTPYTHVDTLHTIYIFGQPTPRLYILTACTPSAQAKRLEEQNKKGQILAFRVAGQACCAQVKY
jgi:hypothetical protein